MRLPSISLPRALTLCALCAEIPPPDEGPFAGAAAEPAPAPTAGKYVPPSMRTRGPGEVMPRGSGSGGPGMGSREDLPTLRVTNISEETQENDLRELFGAFGRVARVYVGRDRETGVGKGFAFVSFDDRINAQKAMEKLNGKGYDNLILSVQWSREYTFLSFSLCLMWSIADCIGIVQNRDLMVDDWFALSVPIMYRRLERQSVLGSKATATLSNGLSPKLYMRAAALTSQIPLFKWLFNEKHDAVIRKLVSPSVRIHREADHASLSSIVRLHIR